MIADTLRQLQAMVGKGRRDSDYRDVPDPRGTIDPEVLMQLLQPNIMSRRDLLDQMFRTEDMDKPTEEDYKTYPELKIDQDIEQTPENMLINQMLAAKRDRSV